MNLVRFKGTTKWHTRVDDARTACGLTGVAELRNADLVDSTDRCARKPCVAERASQRRKITELQSATNPVL